MLLLCNENIVIVNNKEPYFKVSFEAGIPVDVSPEVAEVLLSEHFETVVLVPKEKHVTTQSHAKNFQLILRSIEGITLKVARDIMKVYKDEESLIEAINRGDTLPFHDDIETVLKKAYKKGDE